MIVPLIVLLFLAALAPLRAQDEPVHMRPEFALNFPLAQNDRDVTVKYPIMINPTTVLKPGMQLRVLYVLSIDAGGKSDLVLAHHGTMEQSYSRDPAASTAPESSMPPEMAHEIEGYRRTVWDVPNNFVLAMAQYPTVSMHLIYSPTSHNDNLKDERFSFFDGLFVGSPNGKVAVIAVEKESHADQAGLKAGDEIISVGGLPTRDDLATFAAAYAKAKETATENQVSSYAVMVRSPGQSEARQVNVPMPPRLGGGLMDSFKR